MQTNILEYLEATAPRLPDKIAYSDGTDDLTFAELSHHAKALGSALAQRGYYRRPLAVLMKKHPNTVAAFYGCVYAGCFYVPLDIEMPTSRIELILENAKPAAIITDQKGSAIAKSLNFGGEVLSAEELFKTEINDSLDAIKKELPGQKVLGFCLPYNAYNDNFIIPRNLTKHKIICCDCEFCYTLYLYTAFQLCL